ncbi:MAG: cobalamin biosynthesis protein [Myxococcales bacterium]|nr:cobalamin biosynthesis protein [Myxococcales bacterium]
MRALLESPGLPRLGLVVNEFGALDVDGALLAAQGADVVKLPNGCVCCAAGGDLAAAINRLLRADEPPEIVVVELSGVADPYPVRREIELLGTHVRLTNLIGVVDLELSTSAAVQDPALLRLLSMADTIVLNKEDRAAPPRAREWTDLVTASNPHASAHTASFGRVGAHLLLSPPVRPQRPRLAPLPASHRAFHSITVTVPDGLTQERLVAAFSAPDSVERAKGFVHLVEGMFLFQVVRGRAMFEALPRSPPALVVNKVVLIGADGAILRDRLATLW